jgi:signal transduction histidine kinase
MKGKRENITILFVDDDRSILHSLRRNLIRDSFASLFSQSGKEALEVLTTRHVDVIVADLRMPEMDGIQLLQVVRQQYPEIVRLVLSASSDVDRILDTINKGEVFRFIVKPVDDLEQFRRTLGQAMAQVTLTRRAHESERLKSEFLASVTHELKSPLASIKGFANTLLRNRDMDIATREEFLQMTVSECDRLTQLVTSILDMSRIEAGSFALRMAPTDLSLLIEETCESMRLHFEDKKIDLQTSIPLLVPTIPADRDRLIQVFRNLLDNALKYTPSGGIVMVSMSPHDNDLLICMEDTGCGITTDDLPQVCDKFYRGQQAGARIGGAGLGLAVAKEIIDRHGWTLSIDSPSEEGTRVTIVTQTTESAPSTTGQ